MSITSVTALVHCDGCNEPFQVDLDPAGSVEHWSIHDYAEDAVRGGNAGAGATSVQHDMHLCKVCTKKADSIGDESHTPTLEEIKEALQ